jgi:RNA polymerase sigma-70 factor (ECF subfamily)
MPALSSRSPRTFQPPVAAGYLQAATDEDLMHEIADGDSDAFAELMGRHLGRVVGTASRLLGSRNDGEEIAQEAFIRVWSSAHRWRPVEMKGGASFRAWLYRIVVNLAIDRKRQRVMAALDDINEPVDGSDDGFAQLYKRQFSDIVSVAVSQLPERQRTALTLCFFEGMSNADVGRIMNLTVGAIESLLVRARHALRKDLGKLYFELASR